MTARSAKRVLAIQAIVILSVCLFVLVSCR